MNGTQTAGARAQEQAQEQSRKRNPDRPYGSWLLGPADQGFRRLRLRVQVLLTVLVVGDNLVGAVITSVLAVWVIPSPEPTRRVLVSLLVTVPIYFVVAALVGAVWGTGGTLRATHWLRDEREPSPQEARATLRTPLRITAVQATMWGGGTVLFSVLSLVLQPSRVLATAFTVAISGLVVSGFAYVLTEFAMRPVAARVLGEGFVRSPGLGVRYRLLVFWLLGTGAPVVGIVVTAIVVLAQRQTSLVRLAVVMLVLGVVVLVFGFALTALSARAVVGPVVAVRDALQRVEQGDLDVEMTVYDGTELGLLQTGVNQMVAGLREREHLRDVFGRHVGRDVAAAALDDVELGGEAREVTVLFVDLVGSTTYADEHDPAEVVDLLNRFFAVVVAEVDRREGLVNKFIGDAVLAIFGAPTALPDHATRALEAARTMAARLAQEVPDIGAGIGVATGQVVAGNVGEESRFEYTVIGDAVNSAARLTDLAKDVDGGLLAAWASVEAAQDDEAARWERHGSTRLRGRSGETELAVPVADPTTD